MRTLLPILLTVSLTLAQAVFGCPCHYTHAHGPVAQEDVHQCHHHGHSHGDEAHESEPHEHFPAQHEHDEHCDCTCHSLVSAVRLPQGAFPVMTLALASHDAPDAGSVCSSREPSADESPHPLISQRLHKMKQVWRI